MNNGKKIKMKGSRRRSKPHSSREHSVENPAQLETDNSGKDRTDFLAVCVKRFHPDLLGDLAYFRLAESMGLKGEHLDAAYSAPLYFQKEMRPKDGLERLALTQLVLAEGRAAWLTKLATMQTNAKSLNAVLAACERATGTYVRLMRALSDYRQPMKGANISIGQANVAGQQLVQNIQNQRLKEKYDEQTKIKNGGGIIDAEILSSVPGGIESPQSCNPDQSTVDKKHRPKKLAGKDSGRGKCAKTR
jgi:hypothetical protein